MIGYTVLFLRVEEGKNLRKQPYLSLVRPLSGRAARICITTLAVDQLAKKKLLVAAGFFHFLD